MNITKHEGYLEMQADTNERREIARLCGECSSEITAEDTFICDYLPDFEQVEPWEVGALTSAPIISDGESVYGYMNYQVSCFLEELAAGRSVRWEKG